MGCLFQYDTFIKFSQYCIATTVVSQLLLVYFSYNRLGVNAEEKDADEIIEMANKASLSDQQKQVQDNIHVQVKNICGSMDDILRPDLTSTPCLVSSASQSQNVPRRSGLGLAIGRTTKSINQPG